MADAKPLGREIAPLCLRLALGAIFFLHGAQKLALLDPGRSLAATQAALQNFATKLSAMGLEPAMALAWAAALAEFLGGVFVALGLATRLAAAAIAAVMVVAIWKVHLPNGLIGPGGFEYNVVVIAACAALIVTGGGSLSLDALVAGGGNKKKI
jgi:putative oxidoreductase